MYCGKTITLVVATARNRAIGLEGAMPWHLPRELAHFKSVTIGHAVVMGRKTHESIGRPLPGRQNIIVSRNPDYQAEGCEVVSSLENALEIAASGQVMIIGGGELYRLALPVADRMVLTLVDCEPEADTWFPEWDDGSWVEIFSRHEQADEKNPFDYTVIQLRREAPAS